MKRRVALVLLAALAIAPFGYVAGLNMFDSRLGALAWAAVGVILFLTLVIK